MDRPLKILIDADSIYFRVVMASQNKKDIRQNINHRMKFIKDDCALMSDDHELFVAVKGKGNYRFDIDPNYKGHRPELEPKIKEALAYAHNYMVEEFNAVRCDGMEADDQVTMWAWECIRNQDPYIVVHIDKDLNMIPGSHYNFVKENHYYVDFDEAHLYYMKQCLTGDKADGIAGIKGIGPVKADRAFEGVPFDKRWHKVKDMWGRPNYNDLLNSAKLLWMCTCIEEVETKLEGIEKRLEAKTLDEFWTGGQDEDESLEPHVPTEPGE